MEIKPFTVPAAKTEAVQSGSITDGVKLQELESAALDAVGKNFIKASAEAVNEALENMPAAGHEEGGKEGAVRRDTGRKASADEAVLSAEAVSHGGKTGMRERLSMQAAADLEKRMELLKEWQIHPSRMLSAELSELKEIYHALLQNIRENCSGAELELQIDRLHTLLLDIVGKEGRLRYPELLSFFSQYGDAGADEVLQYLVLKHIMGNGVSLCRVQDAGGDAGGSVYKRPKTQEGILYHRAAGRNVHKVNQYQEQVRNAELSELEILTRADCRRLRGKSYSVRDIELAESFVRYFQNGGNVFQRLRSVAGNEILAGFLLAENMLKAEVCTDCADLGKSMAQDIRQAFRKLTEAYLNYQEEGSSPAAGASFASFPDAGKIRQVYYQIMQVFHRLKMPGKAMNAGLEYAVKEFYSENSKERVKKKSRNSLFDGLISAESEKSAWEKGGKMLERDWEKFLISIGGENLPYLQWAFSIQSPWLALEEAAESTASGGSFHPGLLLLILAMAVIILILIGSL